MVSTGAVFSLVDGVTKGELHCGFTFCYNDDAVC